MSSINYQPSFVRTSSLWLYIENKIAEHEKQEVKSALGEELVDQTLELHEEVNTWMNIWKDYKSQVVIPEPPEIRQLLKQEISFFVKEIRRRAEKIGISPSKALEHHRTDIIEYATSGCASCRTPSDGAENKNHHNNSSDYESLRSGYDVENELKYVSDNLTVYTFDDVQQHLRSLLKKEVVQLGKDVQFLWSCLNGSANEMDSLCPSSNNPTINELKEERMMLEKDAMQPDISLITISAIKDVKNSAVLQSIKYKSNKRSNFNTKSHVDRPHREFGSSRSWDDQSKIIRYKTSDCQSLNEPIAADITGLVDASAEDTYLLPSISTALPRPRSVARFRQMVLDCRDGP